MNYHPALKHRAIIEKSLRTQTLNIDNGAFDIGYFFISARFFFIRANIRCVAAQRAGICPYFFLPSPTPVGRGRGENNC